METTVDDKIVRVMYYYARLAVQMRVRADVKTAVEKV